MNENSPLKTPAISSWLRTAAASLKQAGIDSARLDAELILAHTLQKSRTYLHAHGDEILSPRQAEIADARLHLRVERTPLAYIIGHKEFYGHQFKVTPSTLIPRPESEVMLELLLEAWALYEDSIPGGSSRRAAEDIRLLWGRRATELLRDVTDGD